MWNLANYFWKCGLIFGNKFEIIMNQRNFDYVGFVFIVNVVSLDGLLALIFVWIKKQESENWN